MPTLGIDIGGANLKFADASGKAFSTTFPMWKRSTELSDALLAGAAQFGSCDQFAITMTGEMADCFANRSEGVRQIVNAVGQALKPASFYSVDGHWYSAEQALEDPISVAASNWRALAQYVANEIDTPSILVDIGSTTTDIISLEPGEVLTSSRTDLDRLLSHELVYTGLERSNVAGLLHQVEFENRTYPIVNELFATALDAHLVLGNLLESQSCDDTADGFPRTIACAKQRLARAIGADADWVSEPLIGHIAKCVRQRQVDLISAAIRKRLEEHNASQVVISGHGGILVQSSLQEINWSGKAIDLSQLLGAEASRAACAYAVAVLEDKIAAS